MMDPHAAPVALHAPPVARYAVLDGAQIDGLPAKILAAGLSGRPLYLEVDESASTMGPWLVETRTDGDRLTVEALVAGAPAVVWWSWYGGKHELYRHLRRQTLIEIPQPEGRVWALFRFADPRVLVCVLPEIDAGQLARLLGRPDAALLFAFDRRDYVVTWPDVECSDGDRRIRLSAEQYARVAANHDVILRGIYTERYAPRMGLHPIAARPRVDDAFARARSYGLEDMEDIADFLELDIAHGARFEFTPQCALALASLKANDDRPAQRLFEAKQALLESGLKSGPHSETGTVRLGAWLA